MKNCLSCGLLVASLVACGEPAATTPPVAPTTTATPVAAQPTATTTTMASATPAAPAAPEVTASPDGAVGTLAPNTGIAVGKKIPDVHAIGLDGKDVALSALVAKGPVMLIFYRGGWCPYCNSEIHALTTAYPEFQKRGVTLVAVSVDTPSNEAKTTATYSIPFPVLSDSDAKVIDAFHVVNNVPPDQVAMMKSKYGLDLEAQSGKTHHKIAIPSDFLIDKKGIVQWAHSDPDFKVRPSPAQLLAAIDKTKL